MRVVIIGAGIMGTATALALKARSVSEVVLLERAVPGAEASSAAAGMLAAQIEAETAEQRKAYVRARESYEAWADELRDATGVDVGYRRTGAVVLGRTDAELETLARRAAEQRAVGLRAEVLEAAALREVEPEVGPSFTGALHFPDEAQVDPPKLLQALAAKAARDGVVTRSGTTVAAIHVSSGRVTGVRIEVAGRAEVLEGDAVVLAAGSWSSLVPGLPPGMPQVEPVRGQLALVEERPPRLRSIAFAGHAYLVPRGDGRVVCGATTELVGHTRAVTAGGVQAILEDALAMAPRLSEAELVRTWCNFRPRSTTGAPLVGASAVPGLYLATGHYRNGILLAKATADAVADAILR